MNFRSDKLRCLDNSSLLKIVFELDLIDTHTVRSVLISFSLTK